MNIDELDKGISAHGMWKSRLKTAISEGKLDITVADLTADNKCAFGKWLYSDTITADERASINYNDVKTLHSKFHKAAAKVADMALKGSKDEAKKLLEDLSGEYAISSAQLTRAMIKWKEEASKQK